LRLGQDIRSVEEWLAFINNTDNNSTLSPSKSATTAVAPKSPSKKTKKKKRRARAAPLSQTYVAPVESYDQLGKTSKVSEQINAVHELLKEATETFAASRPQDKGSNLVVAQGATINSTKNAGSSTTIAKPSPVVSSGTSSNTVTTITNPKRDLVYANNFDEDNFEDDIDMDPDLKAKLDKEVEEFRLRLESVNQYSKSKLTPIFYLPD